MCDLCLLPGNRHIGHRAEVVNFVGLHVLDGRDEAALIEQVAADKVDVLDHSPPAAHAYSTARTRPHTSYPSSLG